MPPSTSYRLASCCGCYSLRTGTIFSGICCILLAIIAIVLLFVTDIKWRTIIIELDPLIVKIVYTINLVMTTIISTLMLAGAIKRITVMMFPWIVLGIILLIGMLISVLYTSITLFLNEEEVNHNFYGALFLLFGLTAFLIYVYFWFVVYSYFQQLRLEKTSLKIGPFGRPYSYQRP